MLLCSRTAKRSEPFPRNCTLTPIPAIVRDKLLAYACILTHEGYPCVFWKDYYNWELGKEETPHGIARARAGSQDLCRRQHGGPTSGR